MVSSILRTLLGSYNANELGPDQDGFEVDKFIESFSQKQKREILAEMDHIISKDKVILGVLNQATGELFLSNWHALKFFIGLSKFVAQREPEPDISEYIE